MSSTAPERPDPPLRAFSFEIPASEEDLASAMLWDAGTAGFVVEPCAEGRLRLLAYFPSSCDPDATAAALTSLGVTGRETAVPEVDWVARFREGFRGFRVAGFSVQPAWSGATPTGRRLIVDPGRAFGTGTHETTRLCLCKLEQLAAAGALGRVLDLGAGTGLLALASLRLGASLAVASELDAEALASAVTHAELNELRPCLVRADGGRAYRPSSFDVVVANITAPLLIERAGEIARLLRPRARLALAGLLDVDVQAVQGAYLSVGLVELEREFDGEWGLLLFTRPA